MDSHDIVPLKTPFGTIVRQDWSSEYYKRVIMTEKFKKHAICAMTKLDSFPCPNRPKERFGFVCAVHKKNDEATDTNIKEGLKENRNNIKTRNEAFETGVYDLNYIQASFARCNNCKIKVECTSSEKGSHCKLEEGAFFSFVDEQMRNHDFTAVEIPVLFQMGIALVSNNRNRMIQAQTRPDDDFYASFGLMSLRESMEYRKAMKNLGLTREQRKHVRSDGIINDGTEKGITSVADLLSSPSDDIEIEQIKTTIRKRSDVGSQD